MTRNVELNGLGGTATDGIGPGTEAAGRPGKVRVNEGDARSVLTLDRHRVTDC